MSGINFQMPERIELDETTYSNTFGRFYIQPLEKGFGVTSSTLSFVFDWFIVHHLLD